MRRRRLVTGLLIPVLLAAVEGGGVAASQTTTVEATPLEKLATKQGARTTWSKYIGRLDGGEAYAIVSAVAVEARAEHRIMRGVRIDLRHEGKRPSCDLMHVEWAVMCDREQAAIFIEEDRLDGFPDAVLAGRAEVHPGHQFGITSFRSINGTGILITGYSLYGQSLTDLADLLASAADQLRNAPR